MSKRGELEAQGYKTYEGEGILVFWNPKVCQHAAECANGNPRVFDPRRRPWVDLSQAPAGEIARIIDRCPSKALQYELVDEVRVVFEPDAQRSAAYVGEELVGECELSVSETLWIIAHTGVRPAFEGRGIARRLVDKVVDEARAKGVRILPLCPYAKRVMERGDEYRDVL